MENQNENIQELENIQKRDQKIERKYINESKCLITFSLPAEVAQEATSIAVAGNFNDWDKHSHQMKKQENGDFRLEVELDAGREYEFRYVIDETRWENAWNADRYSWSEYSDCDNSVIEV
jgi:1,4-alpha-glucan branching enzyme